MDTNFDDALETAMAEGNWRRAAALLRGELKSQPQDHWLWSCFSVVHYELGQYDGALAAAYRAHQLERTCGLALWDMAGALQLLGRHRDAIRVYRRILRTPLEALSRGGCGEGRGRARGLIADSHYRIGLSLRALGQVNASNDALETHLDLRGPGCYSIYRLGELPDLEDPPAQRRSAVA